MSKEVTLTGYPSTYWKDNLQSYIDYEDFLAGIVLLNSNITDLDGLKGRKLTIPETKRDLEVPNLTAERLKDAYSKARRSCVDGRTNDAGAAAWMQKALNGKTIGGFTLRVASISDLSSGGGIVVEGAAAIDAGQGKALPDDWKFGAAYYKSSVSALIADLKGSVDGLQIDGAPLGQPTKTELKSKLAKLEACFTADGALKLGQEDAMVSLCGEIYDYVKTLAKDGKYTQWGGGERDLLGAVLAIPSAFNILSRYEYEGINYAVDFNDGDTAAEANKTLVADLKSAVETSDYGKALVLAVRVKQAIERFQGASPAEWKAVAQGALGRIETKIKALQSPGREVEREPGTKTPSLGSPGVDNSKTNALLQAHIKQDFVDKAKAEADAELEKNGKDFFGVLMRLLKDMATMMLTVGLAAFGGTVGEIIIFGMALRYLYSAWLKIHDKELKPYRSLFSNPFASQDAEKGKHSWWGALGDVLKGLSLMIFPVARWGHVKEGLVNVGKGSLWQELGMSRDYLLSVPNPKWFAPAFGLGHMLQQQDRVKHAGNYEQIGEQRYEEFLRTNNIDRGMLTQVDDGAVSTEQNSDGWSLESGRTQSSNSAAESERTDNEVDYPSGESPLRLQPTG